MGVCVLLQVFSQELYSQPRYTYSYYGDVQPIIYKHCISCHRPGQVGPFSLLDFEDIRKRSAFVQEVTEHNYMPPWMASVAFREFKNQRRLTTEEIAIIKNWVLSGCPEGNKKKGIDWKAFVSDSLKETKADVEVFINKPHQISGDNKDDFRIFVLPTGLDRDVFVRSIEFVPGNRRVVHHARIMIDTSNALREDDGIAVGSSSPELNRKEVALYDKFWAGWVPGNTRIQYPEGIAKRLPRNSDLVINVHYSPSSVVQTDMSGVRLYLSKDVPRKEVSTFILDEDEITNGPFFLPANTTSQFFMRSPLLPFDVELLSVLPHMHQLGRSFKAYAITPEGDIVPLIDIPRWNFNWQSTYQFHSGCILPKGTVIYAEATYDNTLQNPFNPNFPPRDVAYGWGTHEEMMNLIFEYVRVER